MQPDMKVAQQNTLYMDMPRIILPDASFYEIPNGNHLLAHYQEMLRKLLVISGCTPKKAVRIAEQTLAFDSLLKPYFKSAIENKDASTGYNPFSLDDLAARSEYLDFAALVSALVSDMPTHVVISNQRFFYLLDEVINEEIFPLLKGWLYG